MLDDPHHPPKRNQKQVADDVGQPLVRPRAMSKQEISRMAFIRTVIERHRAELLGRAGFDPDTEDAERLLDLIALEAECGDLRSQREKDESPFELRIVIADEARGDDDDQEVLGSGCA